MFTEEIVFKKGDRLIHKINGTKIIFHSYNDGITITYDSKATFINGQYADCPDIPNLWLSGDLIYDTHYYREEKLKEILDI